MDNYSKVYVKKFGSAPYNGNYIKQPTEQTKGWKEFNKENNELPVQLIMNAPTSSQPQLNKQNTNYNRDVRSLPSFRSVSDPSYNGSLDKVGRYSGIYTSARGKSAGRTGPLNPIKHWRKQLMPRQGHVTGKPTLNSVMWNPGSTNTLTSNMDTSCCPYNLDNDKKDGMLIQYLINGFQDISNCNCKESDVIRNELSNYQPVYFNNPERVSRPRSSQTKLKKNYYTTGAAYLKSRVKLYEQNQLLSNYNQQMSGSIHNTRPPSNKNWSYPEGELDKGSQAFNSVYCLTDASQCCINGCQVPVTFKPNNPFYGVQGAVDSSTRILQAKYNAIITNNDDFTKGQSNTQEGVGLNVYSIAGDKNSPVINLPGATPIKYRGDSYRGAAPYFVKSKYQKINTCNSIAYQQSSHIKNRLNGIGNRQPSGGSGRITTCFFNSIAVN